MWMLVIQDLTVTISCFTPQGTECMLYFGFYSSGVCWWHHGNRAQAPLFSSLKCEPTSAWPLAIFYFRWRWPGHCSVLERDVEEWRGSGLFPEINENRSWTRKWGASVEMWVVRLPKILNESVIVLLYWAPWLRNKCEGIPVKCVCVWVYHYGTLLMNIPSSVLQLSALLGFISR